METQVKTSIDRTLIEDMQSLESDVQFVIFLETADVDYQDVMVLMDNLEVITYYIHIDNIGHLEQYLYRNGIASKLLRNFAFY